MIAIAVVITVLATVFELVIADRKYGVFSGGFGQSRALDTSAELALFALAYLLAQATLALAAWMLVVRLNRRRGGWPLGFHFAGLFSGGIAVALVARYQLHSYFSDAVDFALVKRLGGGSLTDALLFGKNEIALALVALTVAGLAWWGCWRLLRRYFGRPAADVPAPRPRGRTLLALLLLLLTTAAIVARSGSDARFALARMLAWNALTVPLDLASDLDRDGYGLFAHPVDGHPLYAARHPFALDVPGNGVDEDGLGGDLALVPLAATPAATALGTDAPNLVIVVMESTRYDVIGKSVGGKVVAPNLEALVAQGGVAPAFSHVGFTTDSLRSLFTGRLVARGDASLFTELRASGYRIGVFSGQSEDFGAISETVGMRRSADVFVDAETLRDRRAFGFAAQGSLLVDEAHLIAAFDDAFGAPEDWSRPAFLYFNFQSPHFPYDHPAVGRRLTQRPLPRGAISAANRRAVEAAYWNAVAHADAALGAVVARLKRLSEWENTLLIVTGDHGESLFEDGFLGHGHIVNRRQYGTFLAANRGGVVPAGPVGLSDYRGVILSALAGRAPPPVSVPPFMLVGTLDRPTQIGVASGGVIVSLRLDSDVACFEPGACSPRGALSGVRKRAIDALIGRWGSERWAASRQPSRE